MTRKQQPKLISINNGHSYISADQLPRDFDRWGVLAHAMDDETRETVHSEGYDTELAFLERYLELAPCNLVIG